MYLLCIGASRGFAFVEFNATQEAARWMEMKQVERSSVQIPNRCVVARVPPTAPWRQGTVTQPSGPPRGHGCAPIKNFQSTVSNYLSRNPHIFCRLFLIRSQYSRSIRFKFAIDWDSAASRAFICLSIKIRGITLKIEGGSFQSSYVLFWWHIFYLAQLFRATIFAIRV